MFEARFRELPFLEQKQISLSRLFLPFRNALHGSFLNSVHFDVLYCTLSLTFNAAICHRGHYGFFLVTLQRDPSIPLGEASIGPLFSWKPSNHLPPWASGAACHRSLEKHSPCILLPSIRGWMSTNSPVRVITRLENRRLLFSALFGFVNNQILMTMVSGLVSKDRFCPVARLLLNLGSTFRHITLAGSIKSRRGFLCRIRIIAFQQSGLNGFRNSVPQSQSSLATAGCEKWQKKTFLVPVTHFCFVSFFLSPLAFHELRGWFCQSEFWTHSVGYKLDVSFPPVLWSSWQSGSFSAVRCHEDDPVWQETDLSGFNHAL